MGDLETSDRVYGELFNHIDDAMRKAGHVRDASTHRSGAGNGRTGLNLVDKVWPFWNFQFLTIIACSLRQSRRLSVSNRELKIGCSGIVDQFDMTEQLSNCVKDLFPRTSSRVLGQPVLGRPLHDCRLQSYLAFREVRSGGYATVCYAYLLRRRQFLRQAFEQAVEPARPRKAISRVAKLPIVTMYWKYDLAMGSATVSDWY